MTAGTSPEEEKFDPKKIAEELGEFSPPPSFTFEPEFEPPVPRPVPKEMKQGPYEQARRQGLITAFLVGCFCLAASQVEFVNQAAYYILVLKYLDWIGLALIVGSVVLGVYYLVSSGHYAYIQKGHPLPARILHIGHLLEGTKEIPLFRFIVCVEYRHPETGKIDYATVRSSELYHYKEVTRYRTTLQPGDYVTGVYLPEKSISSLRLYGFLGLNPNIHMILKDGKPERPAFAPEKVLAVIIGVVAICALLVVGLYSLKFYSPLEEDPWVWGLGALIGGAVIALIAVLVAALRKKSRTDCIAASIAGLILGGLAVALGMMIVNATLDTSPSAYREVEIVDFWQETTYPLFIRDYSIEFHELDKEKNQKYPSQVEHMQEFMLTMAGAIEVKRGYFGWPWIRQIHPVIVARIGEEEPQTQEQGETAIAPQTPEEAGLGFFIYTDDEQYLPVSEKLASQIWARLKESGILQQ